MKQNIIIILALIFATQVFAENSLKSKGDSLYTAGNYAGASEVYQQIVAQGLESADLYFNMGNAYYKQGLLPSAILHYERALKLSPYDKDIQYNLELAQQYAVDKVEVIDEFFMKTWIKDFRGNLSSDGWAVFSIVLFSAFVLMLLIFTFSRTVFLKRSSFYVGALFLFASVVGVWGAASEKFDITNNHEAIVFSPSVTIKGSPDTKGTDLFILHEGAKVGVIDSVGTWRRIQMLDGNVGWLQKDDIIKI